jgi:hypothetical protein
VDGDGEEGILVAKRKSWRLKFKKKRWVSRLSGVSGKISGKIPRFRRLPVCLRST